MVTECNMKASNGKKKTQLISIYDVNELHQQTTWHRSYKRESMAHMYCQKHVLPENQEFSNVS